MLFHLLLFRWGHVHIIVLWKDHNLDHIALLRIPRNKRAILVTIQTISTN